MTTPSQLDITDRQRADAAVRRRDSILQAVSFAAARFLAISGWEHSIEDVLKRLGTAADVSRVYIFQNHAGAGGAQLTSQRYEWVAPGIVPQIGNQELQGFSYQGTGFQRWEEHLSRGDLIDGHVRAFPPQERAVLAAHGIESIVVVPIFVGQTWWGHIGFDQCGSERVWSGAEMDALKAAAGILGATIQREQSEQKYRSVVDNIKEVVFQADTAGAWTFLNRAWTEITGFPVETSLGTSALDYVHPEDRAYARKLLRSLIERERSDNHGQIRLVTADADVRWIEFFARVTAGAGDTLVEIMGTLIDITERKRAEAERVALERKLVETQKLESLGVLAGGIAHDFNNLLMAILGNAQLARLNLPAGDSAHESLAQIEIAARRAAELTGQMLAYAGQGRLVVRNFDLNLLLEEISALLNVSIAKTTSLHYRLAPRLPPIEGDAAQLRQVVMNLVINAAEAVGEAEGQITLSTGVRHVDQAYLATAWLAPDLPEGRYVYLEVADTGHGMDAETLAKVFDPFFTTKFTGRGLGLAAVLGIVRGHGGALKVWSKPGQGTVFTVLLPCAAISAPEPEQPPVVPVAAATGALILVADDEEGVRSVAARMLEHAGFRVLTAADGRAAVELFRSHADAVAAVLLDLTMPRMNGEEALRAMRQIKPDACVVMMSGHDERGFAERFAGLNPAGFLQKPFTPSALQEKVRRILGP